MNKKIFLKQLEKRLQILAESERVDIVNEYSDIIDEKIKHGKSEEETINDIGSLNELTDEILRAYKINPEYNNQNKKNNTEKLVGQSEDFIKKTSKKLSEFSKKIAKDFSDNDIKIETIFEIIIKIAILLAVFIVLRLPFFILNELGKSFLEFTFTPLDSILIFTWSLVVSIFYIVTCILIGFLFFKTTIITKKEENTKEELREEPSNKKKANFIKEEYSENKIVKADTDNSLKIVLRIIIFFIFILPILLINIGLMAAATVLVYLLIKGVNVIGPLIIIVGSITIFSYLSKIIYSLTTKFIRIYLFPFTIGIICLVFGTLFSIDTAINFNYYDQAPTNLVNKTTKTYTEIIDGKTKINNDGSRELIIDNNIEDNKLIIEIEYYTDFIDINKYNKSSNIIDIQNNYKDKNGKNILKIVVDNLKNDEIYNYKYLFKASVKIYANESTINLII